MILVIASHPDDEILGCGGTMAKLSSQGHEVATLFLTTGITSREYKSSKKKVGDVKKIHKHALKANSIVGVKKNNVFFLNYHDQKLDTVPFYKLVGEIKKIINKLKPQKVFTHHPGDYNKDHRICYEAVLHSARVSFDEFFPEELFCFEVASSTERSFGTLSKFIPNYYVDIEYQIEKKLLALKTYSTEIKVAPHPRSVEGVKAQSSWRGFEVGLKYAEAFFLVRKIEI
tara:strand:+ start:309 stop:995 length:687 start_codon:yes stop_codon:yes gene_type:complete